MSTEAKKKGGLDGFMNALEKACNKLPTPFTLFVYLFFIVAIFSAICSMAGLSVVHPTSGDTITANNFFSSDGVLWLLKNLVSNFTGYAPLGLVLVMAFGIGLCEQTGMLSTMIRKAMANVPAKIVPFVVALIGINGNIASDSCSIIIPPLAAMAFMGVGLNPIAGMVCAYAGTNAGFSANLMIAGTDSLIAGITNSVLEGFTDYRVEVTCNWFFMIASTFMLSIVFGLVDIYIVEPRMGAYTGKAKAAEKVTEKESKALGVSGMATLVYCAVIGFGYFSGLLANPDTGGFLGSPLLSGIIPVLFGLFFVAGSSYGIAVGSIKGERDLSKMLTKAIASFASYITFVFAAAQFNSLFNWSRMGTMLAIAGAEFLEHIGFTGLPMMICFIILCTSINLLMTSGSAKWTLLAPVFVPMFMFISKPYDPAFIQLCYRIGDSCTNILSPTSAYIFMILGIAQETYDPDIQIGTLFTNLLPHSMAALVCWIIFMSIWATLGLPVGPGSGVYLPAGIL